MPELYMHTHRSHPLAHGPFYPIKPYEHAELLLSCAFGQAGIPATCGHNILRKDLA